MIRWGLIALAAIMAAGCVHGPHSPHSHAGYHRAKADRLKHCDALRLPLSTASRRHNYWRCIGRTR